MQNLYIKTDNAGFAINVGSALLIFHSGILHTGKLKFDC
jgi:hypothetical protein